MLSATPARKDENVGHEKGLKHYIKQLHEVLLINFFFFFFGKKLHVCVQLPFSARCICHLPAGVNSVRSVMWCSHHTPIRQVGVAAFMLFPTLWISTACTQLCNTQTHTKVQSPTSTWLISFFSFCEFNKVSVWGGGEDLLTSVIRLLN